MSKHFSPLLGYNNNVRHKNRVFHIQTEDSGVKHPHIITHLFMDGGRILKSVKRSYAEHVGADGMKEIVKKMMKEQHKAMFIALRDGQYDTLVEGPSAGTSSPDVSAKADPKIAGGPTSTLPTAAPTITDLAPPPSAPAVTDDVEMEPMTTRTPLMIDVESIERAGTTPQPLVASNDLPPPPANALQSKHATGSYRASTPIPPPKKPSVAPKKASVPPKAPSEGRYAAARPAAIFGQARPQQGSSIFGEDLISDKSLDEVILSYLAEDLEPPSDAKRKK